MCDLWTRLHYLFDTDDGSLPDIFVENLSNDDVRNIYRWLRSQCGVYSADGDPTLWDRVDERDVPIESIDDPVQLVLAGRAEPFRHGLTGLSISGVELPQLTVAVYSDEIQFDYRMGPDWGAEQVTALLELLWTIQEMAPAATMSQAREGDSKRSQSFTDAWLDFKSERRAL